MRDPESLAKGKNLSTVCDVVAISFKALKETIVRVLEFLSQETSLRSRRLEQKSPYDLKVTSFLSRRNIWDVKEISLLIFLSCCGYDLLASLSKIMLAPHSASVVLGPLKVGYVIFQKRFRKLSRFDWTLRCWVCVCCFVLLYFGCYIMLCVKKKKNWVGAEYQNKKPSIKTKS